ncbi:MAG: BrnT family toxin, partial [Defluviitaleaceae bacterium]|nr:BrnT family toxin [Defluviitaleaceae bacterium]
PRFSGQSPLPLRRRWRRTALRAAKKCGECRFFNKQAVYLYDEVHSSEEDRFVVIGKEDTLKTELTVCHCYRGSSEEIVRIISARKATKKETKIYISGGAEE